MNSRRDEAYHPVLGEIRDGRGFWHTGSLTFSGLADVVGTTTSDVMRRLSLLGVVDWQGDRHRVTRWASQKGYATTLRKRGTGDKPRLEIDLILPQGMVLLVQNLHDTNMPLTEVEKLSLKGMSQRAIGIKLGISQQAVHKRLRAIPPRLTDWAIVGSWSDSEDADNDNSDNLSECAA